jgi:hypothetical protein
MLDAREVEQGGHAKEASLTVRTVTLVVGDASNTFEISLLDI